MPKRATRIQLKESILNEGVRHKADTPLGAASLLRKLGAISIPRLYSFPLRRAIGMLKKRPKHSSSKRHFHL
ncbi:hypothetical protein Krac_0715 [Ktedonobacter racemifer DSM 44963]|uniref:Uncharacterized protein n=1 Tax=Ktedonobacter racemifer DSM 44963 TaxID=485913 RepID=D6U8E1_KTERA|nr:hypothetical protein Krac_0715 [Ktedonobacter racemifer DSM 44963]